MTENAQNFTGNFKQKVNNLALPNLHIFWPKIHKHYILTSIMNMNVPSNTSPNSASTWLRASDLAQVSFSIAVTNAITHSLISDSKSEAGQKSLIQLTGISAASITMTVPVQSCALGQFLNVKIRRTVWSPGEKKPPLTEIDLTGKVADEEPLQNGSKCVSLALFQVDIKTWTKWLDELNAWQDRINTVVRSIDR